MKTLLLGMGNPILSDDAVGVKLAQDFKARFAGAAGLTVIEECSIGGLNILDFIQGYDRIILIDSVKTVDGVPGRWYRFDGRALRNTMNLDNVHDVNFATALELGRRLGMKIPEDPEIHIFAVEIEENAIFAEELTPRVKAAYPELVAEIGLELEALLLPTS